MPNYTVPIFGGPHHGQTWDVAENEYPPNPVRLPVYEPRSLSRRMLEAETPVQTHSRTIAEYEYVANPWADGLRVTAHRAYIYMGNIERAHLEEYRDWLHTRIGQFRRGSLTRAAESARLSLEGFNVAVNSLNIRVTDDTSL